AGRGRAAGTRHRDSQTKAGSVTLLALIRHMPTDWNAAGRLQGREDVPLSSDTAPQWRVPAELDGFRWLTSPLRRAIDTARRLGIAEPTIEPRLPGEGRGGGGGGDPGGPGGGGRGGGGGGGGEGRRLRAPGGASPREGQAA